VSDKAREWLATQGYDKSMGARPMSRLIQDQLKRELASELLFGQLSKGGEVKVGLRNDKLTFKYSSVEAPKSEA
jgi:ATP-dependent Clp protease ATP-binding subunit ClpA